jgi:hypothetical protein
MRNENQGEGVGSGGRDFMKAAIAFSVALGERGGVDDDVSHG